MEILWSPWRMAFIDPTTAEAGDGGAATNSTARGGQETSATAPTMAAHREVSAGDTDVAGSTGVNAQEDEAGDAGQEKQECVFCRVVAQGEQKDHDNLVLLRGERCFVILNLYPYNTGHLMVVPYRHLGDITLLSPAEGTEMMSLLQRMVGVLNGEYKPEAYNAGMNLGRVAGAGIADHLHMHLVPRWAGDTNFMPVVSQTKVMPEALSATYARLKRALGGA